MAGWSPEDKTEDPTPRRREQARKEGQVALSSDLTTALSLLAAAIGLWLVAPQLGAGMQDALREVLPNLRGADWGTGETIVWSRWLLARFITLTTWSLVGLTAIGLLVTLLQTGWHVSSEALGPKWSRVSPLSGWSRVMSLDGLMRGGLSLGKLVLALAISASLLWAERFTLRLQTQGTLRQSVNVTWETSLTLLWELAMAAVVLAGFDYLFRRHRHEQQLRMSRQEVKQESRDDQGDPQIRARRRSMQRQAASRQSLREVPEATLVITNPTHISVALQYRRGQAGAPKVIAMGEGRMAFRIREIAREHGIPVQEHKPLARALFRMARVGEEIPVEFYQAVAEVLAAVYRKRRIRSGAA
ncbi:MAG: EscU/YscU/HrcU family type III secretion system export apparatus switch protein [Planctomycetaceae bacterium]